MPVADLVLTELPAEQDFLLSADRREVEEAFFERLDLGTRGIDLLRAPCDCVRFALDLLAQLMQIAGHQVAAVSGDPRHELPLTLLGRDEATVMSDHPLDDRA